MVAIIGRSTKVQIWVTVLISFRPWLVHIVQTLQVLYMKNKGIICSNSAPITDISKSIHISVPVLKRYASSKFSLDWPRITHTYTKYKVVKLQSVTRLLLQADPWKSTPLSLYTFATYHPRFFQIGWVLWAIYFKNVGIILQ